MHQVDLLQQLNYNRVQLVAFNLLCLALFGVLHQTCLERLQVKEHWLVE